MSTLIRIADAGFWVVVLLAGCAALIFAAEAIGEHAQKQREKRSSWLDARDGSGEGEGRE